jgi:hypothetical protein
MSSTGTADILICLDYEHVTGNEEGPVFDGPLDAPIWALYVVTVASDGEWEQELLGEGLTYQGALDLAEKRGLGRYRVLS